LRSHADYFCLNLSCPNTREGRAFFSETDHLIRLLDEVGQLALRQPIFLKIAPFGGVAEIEGFLEIVNRAPFVAGFAVHLPAGKPAGLRLSPAELGRMPGAVSGKPCEQIINNAVREFYRRMDRQRYRLIAAGGVFSAEDAYRKIRLGAS